MKIKFALLMLTMSQILNAGASGLVVIGHESLPALDAVALQRIYTGKAVSVGNRPVMPVNLSSGHAARKRFLDDVLGQDEDKYTGYWIVRRYIGKGAPPAELDAEAEVVRYVGATPGAIGYVDEASLPAGAKVKVLMRR